MDDRFVKEEGPEIFSGNELVLKGALEAGCSLLTGYPGSPISELFDAAQANADTLRRYGLHAELAHNEALAAARLNGARMAGARAIAAMKSVGLHVAADGLALGNLSEPGNAGGCLVVVGDDPAMVSTQINNDSRFLSQHLHMPVLQPATLQEQKDWVNAGLDLSGESDLYLTYLVTTPQADGGGTVWVHPNRRAEVRRDAPRPFNVRCVDAERTVLLPPRTGLRERTLGERFERLRSAARRRHLTAWHRSCDRAAFGFIAAGLPYCYLVQTLQRFERLDDVIVLKPALVYPLDPEDVLALASAVETVIVVEEKRGLIESQVADILRQARQDGRLTRDVPVWGKRFPQGSGGFPAEGALSLRLVEETIRRLWPTPAAGAATPEPAVPLPVRSPTFCPGCPHRDSSSVFLEIQRDLRDPSYMARHHRQKPLDLVFHGETGCFSMLMFEPNQSLMHNYSGMGLGGGTGAGADPFITNKQVVFLGDSTFFHSGLIAISDSCKNGQDILYVILDNKTTAMTGHQPTAGTAESLMGEKTYAQNIEAILKALAGQKVPVWRVDPGDRSHYRRLLERTVLQDGVKVVIADKECGLLSERRQRDERQRQVRASGFVAEQRFIQINPDACEFCLACTQLTGCPGLTFTETAFGRKVQTDPSLCVADGACTKLGACPAFEEVVVTRRQAPISIPVTSKILAPRAEAMKMAQTADHAFIHITGVGGQGIGLLASAILRAAHAERWRTLFTETKGLAVRNGAVQARLLLTRAGGVLSAEPPAGEAPLLIGLDALEAERAARDYSRVKYRVVAAQTQLTTRMLTGKDEPAWPESDGARGVVVDAARLARESSGDSRYANMVLLGAAFAAGQLPLSRNALMEAIRDVSPPPDRAQNLTAFAAGESPFTAPSAATPPVSVLAARDGFIEELAGSLDLPEALADVFRVRAAELRRYGGPVEMERYARAVRSVYARDQRDRGFQATAVVVEEAFRVIAIKDEFYVADLLSRREKRARDLAHYGIVETRGDRLTVRHWNQPTWRIGSWAWTPHLRTRSWQLRWLARLAFVRRWWPGWRSEDRRFRDWYLDLAARFDPRSEAQYETWVRLLRLPESVRGYGDMRRRGFESAYRLAESLMAQWPEWIAELESR